MKAHPSQHLRSSCELALRALPKALMCSRSNLGAKVHEGLHNLDIGPVVVDGLQELVEIGHREPAQGDQLSLPEIQLQCCGYSK